MLLILYVSPMMPTLLSRSRARSHSRFLLVTRNKIATVYGRGRRSRTKKFVFPFARPPQSV